MQITGRGGQIEYIYGDYSLPDQGIPIVNERWLLGMRDTSDCVCPFDEESITQLEIRIGGIVLLKPFLMADDQFYCEGSSCKGRNFLRFQVVPFNRNTNPIYAIHVHIGLAASSSTSMDDAKSFQSLIKSFYNNVDFRRFQLMELLHHFHTVINADGEQRNGSKLTMIIERIEFRKDYISGCLSLMDELGVQTTDEDD